MKSLRCWLGRHRWASDGMILTGYATLSWGLRPTREWAVRNCCLSCGKRKQESGWVIPSDSTRFPSAYGLDGWPLIDGRRMPIRGASL
jgi:hypothetical protein